MSIEEFDRVLLVAAGVLLAAVVAVRLSSRTGLPSLLLYVALGLLLGEDGLGVEFNDAGLAHVLGYGALVLILAEGGLTTSWPAIRRSVPAAASLAVVGSIVSLLVTAGAAYLVLGRDWVLALLVGAVVSSTDAAAVFSVLRQVPLPRRVVGLLEAESGFNDAPIVILVVALAEVAADGGGRLDVPALAGTLVFDLTAGALVGGAVGALGSRALRRVSLPSSGLYPITVLALAVAAYGAASAAHASGFLAVYVASLVLGNARLPHGPATRGFAEAVGWLAQIGLFVMLGLLATPSELPGAVLPALAIGGALLLLARPLSVLVAATPFRVPWRQQAFLSWAGLRGGVPIVLATVPVTAGVPDSDLLFNVVFVLVVVFTLVQAPTLPAVARRLRLGGPEEARELDVDASPLVSLGADLLQLRVPEDSRLHGVEVSELRLPPGAALTLVVRDGQALVPGARTTLRHGDELLLVVTADLRPQVERRLRAVSRRGRLAGWYGEDGAP